VLIIVYGQVKLLPISKVYEYWFDVLEYGVIWEESVYNQHLRLFELYAQQLYNPDSMLP
jgi:hypothetical protein